LTESYQTNIDIIVNRDQVEKITAKSHIVYQELMRER